MLTPEKINLFNQLIANNQTASAEDSADFEMYKALRMSQAIAERATESAVVPAPVAAPAPAVVMPTTVMPMNGSSFSMNDLMSNSMTADTYLKVKYQQTFVGDTAIANPELYVSINLKDIVCKMSIKGGNPVVYASTIDGKTCTSGGTWLEAVEDIKAKDPKARPYYCVDLPMKVAKDITSFTGAVVAPAGTILGHTTATTNWKNWCNFYRNLPNTEGTVFVKVTREDIKKNTNQWAVLNFEYISDEQAKALGLAE